MSWMAGLTDSVTEAHNKGDKIIRELETQTHELGRIAERVQSSIEREDFRRIPAQGVVDSSGVLQFIFTAPLGIGWELISITATAAADNGSGTEGCFVYLNTNEPINLIRVITYGQRMSDDFTSGEYVPPGQNVILELTGQPPGQACTANLKVKMLKD